MEIKNTSDLRKVLLDTISKVKSKAIGTKEAQAIAALSSRVIQSAELDLKAARYADQYNGSAKSSVSLIGQK